MKQWLKLATLTAVLMYLIPALAADAPDGGPAADDSPRVPQLLWPENARVRRLLESRRDGSAQQSAAASDARRNLVVQAFLKNVPEVFQGPEQTGIYAVALLLRPDGSVFRSRKVLLPNEQLSGPATGDISSILLENSRFAWIPFFPVFTDSLGNQLSWIRGTPLADGKVLRVDVAVTYQYLPAGYDETHSAVRVWEAVAAKHADLLRPVAPKGNIGSDGSFNWLVVLMNEDGTIARAQAELVQAADPVESARVGPGSFNLIAKQFKILGLEPAQLGDMGFLRVNVLPDGTPATSPMIRPASLTASAQYREPLESREFMVSFAWPRRPGEPAGGVTGDNLWQPTADYPLDPAITRAIAERYFPDEFVALDQPIERRPWVLLSPRGEVLRTGVVPNTFTVTSAAGRPFTLPYSNPRLIQKALPGVKFGARSEPGVIETEVLDRAGRRAMVRFLWLAPDSPAPPLQ